MFYFDKGCIENALVVIRKMLNDIEGDDNILVSLSAQPCPEKYGKQFICYKIRSIEKEFTTSYYSTLDNQGKKAHYVSFWDDKTKALEKEELVRNELIKYDWGSRGVTGFEEANLSWEEECKAMGYGSCENNHFISIGEFNSLLDN